MTKEEIQSIFGSRMVSFTSRYGHPGKHAVYVLKDFEKNMVGKSALWEK